MTQHLLAVPIRYWACPSCLKRSVTQRPDVHTEFHNCGGFSGAWIPLEEVPDAEATPLSRHQRVEKENGPGISAINTLRGDGSNDCIAFAPTATIAAKGNPE